LLPYILFEKRIYILALEMASPWYQHCASCIGTLAFPVVMHADTADDWCHALVPSVLATDDRGGGVTAVRFRNFDLSMLPF